jgi:peptidyl-prolyl cis-trans isomerase C
MFMKKNYGFQIMAIMIGLMISVLPAWGDTKKPQAEERAAVVNGSMITMEEFNGEALLVQRSVLGMGKPLTCAQIANIQKEVVESLIRREILHQESLKAGIKIDKQDITKEIDTIKKQFLSDAEYKNELTRRNLSEEVLRAQLERNLFISKYVEQQFLKKGKVTDADVKAYYESHLSALKQPLQVRVSHILVQFDSKSDPARKQEARRKAEKILNDLKDGKDFKTIAREQSDGPTRTSGGDLGYIRMGQLEKQFESVVFNLKKDEISDVIETNYGYHLFKVTDRKPESIVSFDNVKEQIKQLLLQEKAKKEADEYARKLREKSDVKILLPELTQNKR